MRPEREEEPLIANIHRFALDDGPGIRTTVFFKGCPLSCAWCHNPESMNPSPEIAFHGSLCIGCGECASVCPSEAISMNSPERVVRSLCTACGVCVEACPAAALRMVGERYSVAELAETLLRDRLFYETSGGGVTFSGGEPTLFMNYLSRTAKELKKEGIHTAIQTSGYFDLHEFAEKALPHVDLIFFDLKIFDPEKHREWTGKGNGKILDNFIYLIRTHGERVVPRIPLIPGATATKENLQRIGRFLGEAGMKRCEVLPYNSGGAAKRILIGKETTEQLRDARIGAEEEGRLRSVLSLALSGARGGIKGRVSSVVHT